MRSNPQTEKLRLERKKYLELSFHSCSAQLEVLTEINLAHKRIVGKLFGRSCFEKFSFHHQIGAIGDGKCLVNVVIADEDANIFLFEASYDTLNFFYCNRINTGKRLVKQNEFRINC